MEVKEVKEVKGHYLNCFQNKSMGFLPNQQIFKAISHNFMPNTSGHTSFYFFNFFNFLNF